MRKNGVMTPEELEYNADMNAKYPSMTKKQLIAYAKENGYGRGISNWRKQDIIDMLKTYATPYNPDEFEDYDDYGIGEPLYLEEEEEKEEEKSVEKAVVKPEAGSQKKETNNKIIKTKYYYTKYSKP